MVLFVIFSVLFGIFSVLFSIFAVLFGPFRSFWVFIATADGVSRVPWRGGISWQPQMVPPHDFVHCCHCCRACSSSKASSSSKTIPRSRLLVPVAIETRPSQIKSDQLNQPSVWDEGPGRHFLWYFVTLASCKIFVCKISTKCICAPYSARSWSVWEGPIDSYSNPHHLTAHICLFRVVGFL